MRQKRLIIGKIKNKIVPILKNKSINIVSLCTAYKSTVQTDQADELLIYGAGPLRATGFKNTCGTVYCSTGIFLFTFRIITEIRTISAMP